MKKVLLVSVVLVLGVGGYCGYQLMKTKGELKPEVARILEQLRDGQVDAVYAETSAQFRENTSAADFRRYCELRQAALGPYKALGSVNHLGFNSGTKGSTGQLDVEVQLEKATVTAKFEFLKEDGRWRLHGMTIPIPHERLPTVDSAEAERRMRGLIELYNEGNAEAFYASFHPALAATLPFDQLGPKFAGLRAAAGKITDVKVTESKTVASGARHLELALTFERGPGTGYFELVVTGDKWSVLGFNLDKRDGPAEKAADQ